MWSPLGFMGQAHQTQTGQAPQTFIGQLATKNFVPQAMAAAGNSGMTRVAHFARGAITDVRFIYPGWHINQAAGTFYKEIPAPNYTTSSWVEYPTGTYTLIDNALTVVGGTNTAGASVAVAIPDGFKFYTWHRATGASGFPIVTDGAFDNTLSFADEYCHIATSGVATTPGTLTDNQGRRTTFGPVAMVGTRATSLPAFALVGDSRTFGQRDTADASTDRGNLARSIGPVHPYINLGVSGDQPSSFLFASARRRELLQYCTHIVDQTGINEFTGKNLTAVNTWAFKQRMAARLGQAKPYVVTTAEASSSSTDAWATTANQTVRLPNRATFNASVRALPHFIELADPVESARDSGRWIVNGTANYATSDGLHASQAGYLLQAATAGTIRAAALAAPVPSLVQPGCDLTLVNPLWDAAGRFAGTQALRGTGTTHAFVYGVSPSVYPQTLEFFYKSSTPGVAVMAGFTGGRVQTTAAGIVQLRAGNGTLVSSTVNIADGLWHHIALTVSESTLRLWVDGVLAITHPFASAIGNAGAVQLSLLSDGNVASPALRPTGSIGEVAVWLTERYTAGFTPPTLPYVGTEAGLVCLHRLNGNSTGILGPVLTT